MRQLEREERVRAMQATAEVERRKGQFMQSLVEGVAVLGITVWFFLGLSFLGIVLTLVFGGLLGFAFHVFRADEGIGALLAIAAFWLVVLVSGVFDSTGLSGIRLALNLGIFGSVLAGGLGGAVRYVRRSERTGW